MAVVAIVGAGTLGGALAQTIAARDRVRSVRLVDEAVDVAAGKALDIRQSAPLDRFGTRVTAHGDLAAAADADIVVLAGPVGAPEPEWTETAGLALLRRLGAGGVAPLILCAGASHRRLVERGVAELGAPPRRLFGSAPEALRAAVTAVVALDAGCPASDVALTVVGIPPAPCRGALESGDGGRPAPGRADSGRPPRPRAGPDAAPLAAGALRARRRRRADRGGARRADRARPGLLRRTRRRARRAGARPGGSRAARCRRHRADRGARVDPF